MLELQPTEKLVSQLESGLEIHGVRNGTGMSGLIFQMVKVDLVLV